MGKDPLSDNDKAINAANSITLSHCKALMSGMMDELERELMEVELDRPEVLKKTIYLATFTHILTQASQAAAEKIVASMEAEDYEKCLAKMGDWISEVESEFDRIAMESARVAEASLDPKCRAN